MGEGDSAIDRAVVEARSLADRFHEAGHSLYLVGGVVRDQYLEHARPDPDLDHTTDARPGPDLDCTTDARPDQIKAVVADMADKIWDQGERFGTIGCRIGSRIFEITTHRADAYEPESRKPVVAFGDAIEPDLARRDFTVNAMALDLADGRIVDPFGGRADLDAGVLRTPIDPRISFSEDPLRMLRAARFIAGYGLAPEPELTEAVVAMADRIDIVSIERVRAELENLLFLGDPEPGFDFLVTTGLWSRLFPDLDQETAGSRARRVAAVGGALAERWAAFASVGDADQLGYLRLPNSVQADVRWLVGVAERLTAHPPADDRGLRDLGTIVPDGERLERALDFVASVVHADGGDLGPTDDLRRRVAELRSREPDFDSPGLPLDGDQVMDILGLEPGPEVGRALDLLRRHRVDHGPLTAEEAVRIIVDS